jgi:metal-responsive CopG/Arc/MetJ family transcriptional regulator
MAKPINFRWDEEFVAALDEARGDVSRSLFVRRAIEAAIHVPTSLTSKPPAPCSLSKFVDASRSEMFRKATQGKTK